MSQRNDIARRANALVDLANQVVERAKAAGADVAESIAREGSHLTTKVRLREPELIEEAGSRGLGLRVMVGTQVAVSYTSDTSARGVARLVDDALDLARLAEPDPFAGPPDASLLSSRESHVDLDLYDEAMGAIGAGDALARAKAAEASALDADPRITNSEGATFSRAEGLSALVTSGGFIGVQSGTYASLSVRPVADDADGKKRSGSFWGAKRHLSELEAPQFIGAEAARRTLAKLGATKIGSAEMPVVFDPDAGRAILGLLAGVVNGGSIYRRSSYLVDRLETQVASSLVTVVDDPLIRRGPGSRAFDGEGLLSRRATIVERGVLKHFLLDSYSARKLGMQSTASATRGGSGGVSASTTNFVLQPGNVAPDEVLAGVTRGLYVTDMMGFGFNAVTGDFSRGASGFLIENGKRTIPVSEVTISLNVDELLKRIDAVATDLDLRTSIATPTFRVSSMTVAGS